VPNPLLSPSPLPYGLPDYQNVIPQYYEEAITQGIENGKAELATILAQAAAPTVANTLEPLERMQEHLRNAIAPFFQVLWADGTDEIEAINLRMAPRIAAAEDELLMNTALYHRLEELAAQLPPRHTADGAPYPAEGTQPRHTVDGTSPRHPARSEAETQDLVSVSETQFLLNNWLKRMRRAGVLLGAEQQSRLKAINTELTELEAKFGQLLVAGNNASAVLVTDRQQLSGLDDEAIAAYASAAQAQGLDGWLISLELTSGQQILSRLQNAELRARIMAASLSRGSHGDENDTRQIISQIAKLRAERAQLLGYENHAAYVADENVIGTAQGIAELLGQLAEPAMRNTRREAAQLAEISAPSVEVTASDWSYLTEQLLRDKFHFDFEQLRPYLELNSVLENGVFRAAHELYGLSFVRRPDLHGYHPEVVVYEVFDDGPQIPNQGRGLVMFDFYARPTKRGGAWMNPIVAQSHLLQQKPVITQTLNLVKPAPGEPTLITWTNVITLFHEFGHALHGLLSDTYYPSQSGVNVPTDFVEYPSQVNEMWAREPELLANYAKHYQTGEPLPTQWYEHLKDTREFGEGFALTEILGANAIDQAWHRLSPEQVPTAEQALEFEQRALTEAGVYFPAVPPRYRSAYYNHIWSSQYAAGYYSYTLSKMYDADTVAWYRENGGLKRENGQKFAAEVLSKGHTRDPKESFRALRGRDVIIEPLLVRLGLTAE